VGNIVVVEAGKNERRLFDDDLRVRSKRQSKRPGLAKNNASERDPSGHRISPGI